MKKLLPALLVATFCSAASPVLPTTPPAANLTSIIHYDPAKKEIDAEGDVTDSMFNELKRLTDLYQFDTLRINSIGGVTRAGMDIGALIKAKGLTLIVDGDCMSACANFMFPAAPKKIVLPGSVVAIHGSATTRMSVCRLEDSKFCGIPEETLREDSAREKAFYSQTGMSFSLLETYDKFVGGLEANHMIDVVHSENGTQSCPPFRVWAPTEDELKAWGVKGIEEFWYPQTPADFDLIAKKSKLQRKNIVFGNAAKLASLCQKS